MAFQIKGLTQNQRVALRLVFGEKLIFNGEGIFPVEAVNFLIGKGIINSHQYYDFPIVVKATWSKAIIRELYAMWLHPAGAAAAARIQAGYMLSSAWPWKAPNISAAFAARMDAMYAAMRATDRYMASGKPEKDPMRRFRDASEYAATQWWLPVNSASR